MKSLAEQTLYEILDVPPDAASAEIERAYERALALYGPGSIVTYTLMSSEEASQLSARIEEARRTLLDEGNRARYDEALGLAAAKQGAPPEGAEAAAPAGAAGGAGDGLDAPSRASAAEVPSVPAVPAGDAAVATTPAPVPLVAGAPASASAAPAAAPAPIPLRVEIPRQGERDVVVAEDTAWTGEVLRRVREARGLSIQQISDRTRVVRHHVENIEADRFGLLPAPVYLRGILQAIARELRLDPQKVSRSYLERLQGSSIPPVPPPARSR